MGAHRTVSGRSEVGQQSTQHAAYAEPTSLSGVGTYGGLNTSTSTRPCKRALQRQLLSMKCASHRYAVQRRTSSRSPLSMSPRTTSTVSTARLAAAVARVAEHAALLISQATTTADDPKSDASNVDTTPEPGLQPQVTNTIKQRHHAAARTSWRQSHARDSERSLSCHSHSTVTESQSLHRQRHLHNSLRNITTTRQQLLSCAKSRAEDVHTSIAVG